MTSCWISLKLIGVCICLVILITLSSTVFDEPLCAFTISTGEPYGGRLIDGIRFPSHLHGCVVGDEDKSYTTPEVVGALLDAFEKFEKRYPDSCDIFIGNFSRQGGGRLKGHESHQNGRDVDIGLFAKGNVQLDRFIPMNSKNLDVAKTWHIIQSLLGTQRVQTIYLDRSIQTQLYKHALSEEVDREFLSKVFRDARGRAEKECIIQHTPGHRNHMHVRFFAPWSTLAGQIKQMDPGQQMMIDVAQMGCLSRRVNYYVKDSDNNLDQMAKNLGVRFKDLCKWNSLSGGEIPRPGECIVIYKREFEPEPIQKGENLATPVFLSPAPLPADNRQTSVMSGDISDFSLSPRAKIRKYR